MSFLDELQKTTNKTVTENGAVTNRSTLDPLLDFFSLAGAMRETPQEAVRLFEKAFYTDKLAAIRTLFYLRDIRGGQGERNLFRECLARLKEIDSEAYDTVQKFIPEYGRWDDLEISGLTVELISAQFAKDEASMKKGEQISLMAKWLPSENTSSKLSSAKAKELAKLLGLKPSQYRRKVVALRKYIKLLEQKMSTNQWAEIDYSKLPSQASRKHVKAFKRHDEERYSKYLEDALNGNVKMNTSTLYTYEVFDTIQHDIAAANAMWANLPDWTNGQNAIVLADVSGSMDGRPMSISVSLALYFAEHNKGIFHDTFMTFSERPQVVKVVGKDLASRLRNIENREWSYNTNLELALDALLDASKLSPEDAPKILYIISDMEFDQACANPSATLLENASQKYEDAGIKLPHIVFWNVNAHQVQAPATKFDNRVTLISGASQSTFRYAVEGKTPLELMQEVINSERYAQITI